MLRFVSSLTMLYAFCILTLIVYGYFYYKSFAATGYQKRRFPHVFLAISLACIGFLWINFHPPLSLKTFSNLDRYALRHDGFVVNNQVNLSGFNLEKIENHLEVTSAGGPDPFYILKDGKWSLVSKTFGESESNLSFKVDSNRVLIEKKGTEFLFRINENRIAAIQKNLNKGVSLWELFRFDEKFINTDYYKNERIIEALRNIFILRKESGTDNKQLVYFLSPALYDHAFDIKSGKINLTKNDLGFRAAVPDNVFIGWGLGFPDRGVKQFAVSLLGQDSFSLVYRYPVSYPLNEEDRNNWSPHVVNKFLVSDYRDMLELPGGFKEGFLFPPADTNHLLAFPAVLFSYNKTPAREPLKFTGRLMSNNVELKQLNSGFFLPAKNGSIAWQFSVIDNFDWQFGSASFSEKLWRWIIFGSLIFFSIVVLVCAFMIPAWKLSWVWQLLTSVSLVLLTTRYFLYWRYKSFPPYEGLDHPSVQQLESTWNFVIIPVVTLILAVVFVIPAIRFINRDREWGYSFEDRLKTALQKIFVIKRLGFKTLFFFSWIAVLITSAGLAAFNNFDQSACRHLAIGLVIAYFLFVFVSYRHSPLVRPANESWWTLGTAKRLDFLVSNPVKVLLSASLLAVYVFIDIGFAIVFVNFLLFNEAFLCINYAIAGLSAGSKRNAGVFGLAALVYLAMFVINLLFAPLILNFLLDLPTAFYLLGYLVFAVILSYNFTRLYVIPGRRKVFSGIAISSLIFLTAFFFFPKERILEKASMTRYRIDVMSMPVSEAIESAYEEGKTWEPVIRAAQNQWFINSFIYEKNNPAVNNTGFTLLPHAPQHKGARYNAQATDLVASRFFIAEHGRLSVILFVILLILPVSLLASFYKLYPDFTNRINSSYPAITTGFSLLNYLLVTALLVILAATGKYIFFGQDLPFGSILSKQSIIFPALIIATSVMLFRLVPIERYPNNRKLLPGLVVVSVLGLILFFVKPLYNTGKAFNVTDDSGKYEEFITGQIQPILNYIDTAGSTKRLTAKQKDRLFSDSLNKIIASGDLAGAGKFLEWELSHYARTGFQRHTDQRNLIYLDLHRGSPELALNTNYFKVEAPPHLQQAWKGNVYGDSSNYNISLWNAGSNVTENLILNNSQSPGRFEIIKGISIALDRNNNVFCVNGKDSIRLNNPTRIHISQGNEKYILHSEPHAFMKNYFVNGSRYYLYPMEQKFTWARHFAESIAADYSMTGEINKNAFVSFDYPLMDSISLLIESSLAIDTSYYKGAEYAVSLADGRGRILAINDFIKGMPRPDPNDKPGFAKLVSGENSYISQSVLRKKAGNLNLLRLHPGPGSTLKPIVFAAIASQLKMDWDQFASEGFSEPQHYFGGEKVAEYDFEKNNGRISSVKDYIRVSDNYYHSNVLLLGSYTRERLNNILERYFVTNAPGEKLHWPWFSYQGKDYWLNQFENWPGYVKGKADFGSDSSFVTIGLENNFGINTMPAEKSFDRFTTGYDSMLFATSYRKSGFILPEYALFDQRGKVVDHRIPYDVFTTCFRGHVKGSSQVMVPPVKMLEAYGKLISQSRNYVLTLNPYAGERKFIAFDLHQTVSYPEYLSLMKENVFRGMSEALYNGTASVLGTYLKDKKQYYYYAKTGTTGDNLVRAKSKLFTLIISQRDIADPDFNFRENKFLVLYFTSQNGPAHQNEKLQAALIDLVENSDVVKRYFTKTETHLIASNQ